MPDLKHAISIDAAPDRVHPLVATAWGLAKWWAADVVEDQASGTVELGFFNRTTMYRLKAVQINAQSEVEWLCQSGKEWSGTKLLFRWTSQKNGTQLKFTHADWAAETDYFTGCNTTWGELMYRLKAAAEGKTVVPLFAKDGLAY